MTAALAVLRTLGDLLFFAALPGVVEFFRHSTPGTTPAWWGTGSHLSRPLRRRFGRDAVERARGALIVALFAILICDIFVRAFDTPLDVGRVVIYAWIADDYWFGDRPRRRRLRSWAKAKLRKAKPVMRRLAERWVPDGNPIPRPA